MTHYHVFAVQDRGGWHQRGKGWEDQLSLADAEKLVGELADADHLLGEGHIAYAEAKYGDRLDELIPEPDMNSFWDAAWIAECCGPCRFEQVFNAGPDTWGKPHWTPPDPDAPEPPRHLHLVP